jgi:hypothetical protein
MIDRSVGLLEPLGAVLTDLQQPICKAGALLTADPIQPFTDSDGDGGGHAFTGPESWSRSTARLISTGGTSIARQYTQRVPLQKR